MFCHSKPLCYICIKISHNLRDMENKMLKRLPVGIQTYEKVIPTATTPTTRVTTSNFSMSFSPLWAGMSMLIGEPLGTGRLSNKVA